MPLLQIGLYLGDGLQLVIGLLIGKKRFEFTLPGVIAAKAVTLCKLAGGIEGEKFPGHLLHGSAHPIFDPLPFAAAEPMQPRRLALRPHIFLDHLNLLHGEVELIAAPVFDQQVIAPGAADLERAETEIFADTVLLMDDIVA